MDVAKLAEELRKHRLIIKTLERLRDAEQQKLQALYQLLRVYPAAGLAAPEWPEDCQIGHRLN